MQSMFIKCNLSNKVIHSYMVAFLVFGVSQTYLGARTALASSDAACAIWLCLPAGFTSGCGAAHQEFKRRIRKGEPPLPSLSSCSTGPNGRVVSGYYEMGYERLVSCKDGFSMRVSERRLEQAKCYQLDCVPSVFIENDYYCPSYKAELRTEPHYIKMWVEGRYLGQFFY